MVLFAVSFKKVAPDCRGQRNNKPIKRTEQKALDRMSVFMDARIVVPWLAVLSVHENEQPQREPAEVLSVDINDPGIMKTFAAASGKLQDQKTDSADQIDCQTPGELIQIKQKVNLNYVTEKLVNILMEKLQLV